MRTSRLVARARTTGWRAGALAAFAALVVGAGCSRAPGDSAPPPDTVTGSTPARVDSIVLERTVCFGFCPAYRLFLGPTGEVRFERLAQRETSADTARDTIPPAALDSLLGTARTIGFFDLPGEITPANQAACPLAATDHPSAIVTIAVGDTVKRVNHYHGCHAERGMESGDAYPALTAFENAIDSAAGVARWLRAK
jgi:hypothetical protein